MTRRVRYQVDNGLQRLHRGAPAAALLLAAVIGYIIGRCAS